MIRTTCFFLFFLSVTYLFAQPINRTFIENDGDTILLGRVSSDRLSAGGFQDWYYQSYDPYSLDRDTIGMIKSSISKVDSITIFMGTWCGDSRREVPRFLKLMEEVGFGMDKMSIICVDHGDPAYKQSPGGEEEGLTIHRVPTFIFRDIDGNEINRIVERPVKNLENDLLAILKGDYQPSYKGVMLLSNLLEEQGGVQKLRSTFDELVLQLDTLLVNPYELNTYARMLLTSFQLTEAELVYELNSVLFPDFFVGQYYLASFKSKLGKYEEARLILEVSTAPEKYEAYKRDLLKDIAQRSEGPFE